MQLQQKYGPKINAPSEKRGVIFDRHNQIMILVTVLSDCLNIIEGG